MKSLILLTAIGLVGTVIGLQGCGSEGSEEMLALERQHIQTAWVGSSEGTMTTGVNLLKSSSVNTRKGRSMGAIRHRWSTGDKGPCGVTFISHTIGLTAAHCVPFKTDTSGVADANGSVTEFVLDSTQLTVEHYDTSALDLNAYSAQSTVQGSWPAYSRPTRLTQANGYKVTELTCTVFARCEFGSVGNKDRCPFLSGSTVVDTALVKCAGRDTTRGLLNWVNVRTGTDPQNLNVEVWWPHEVVYLSTSIYSEIYQPVDNPEHYNFFTGQSPYGVANNYHYTQPGTGFKNSNGGMQLLPLVSKHGSDGITYRALGTTSYTHYTNTNVPGCHGTSGSGVFQAGTDLLLGNIDHGFWGDNGTKASPYLCAPSWTTGNAKKTDYAQNFFVQQFQLSSYQNGAVSGDRR